MPFLAAMALDVVTWASIQFLQSIPFDEELNRLHASIGISNKNDNLTHNLLHNYSKHSQAKLFVELSFRIN